MRKPLIAAVAALTLTGACSGLRESRLNPVNWFGRSTEAATVSPGPAAPAAPADGRVLVEQVTFMAVEPTPGGVILRATGLPPTQGWWDAELVAENDGLPVDGVLVFRFLVAPPPAPQPVSTPVSREVTAAVYISDIRLREVRRIIVRGALNERVSRR